MKNFLFGFFGFVLLSALVLSAPARAQAQTTAPAAQALAKEINQLMRNAQKPRQEVRLTLSGCHAQQLIRDQDADVHLSQALAMSYSSDKSGWAVKMDNGLFELKMDFEWADVTALRYARAEADDDEPAHYQITITKHKKGSSGNTTFSLPLYTTNEAVVKDLTRRLEKLRLSCGE